VHVRRNKRPDNAGRKTALPGNFPKPKRGHRKGASYKRGKSRQAPGSQTTDQTNSVLKRPGGGGGGRGAGPAKFIRGCKNLWKVNDSGGRAELLGLQTTVE